MSSLAKAVWDVSPSLRSLGPLLGVAVCFVLFSFINPTFATASNIEAILDQSAVLMVVSMGLTFVVLLGSIDLSVEGVMAVGALCVALLVKNDRSHFDLGYVGILLAVSTGTCLGLINGVLNTFLGLPSFMTTLGTWSVGLGIASLLVNPSTPAVVDPSLLAWGRRLSLGISPLVFIAAATVALGYVLQRYTRLGRYAYAIGGSEEIARQSGIRVRFYKCMVFALAGTFYGLAGVMTSASLASGVVKASNGYLFSSIAALVVGGTLLTGGRGGVLHSVIGVFLIVVISDGMVLVGVDPFSQKAVQSLIIVSVVAAATWHARHQLRVVK